MANNLNKVFDIMKSAGRGFSTRHQGNFGVEIETEAQKPYDWPKLKFWNIEKDGSLRVGGAEYILKAPMHGPELEKALEEFQECDKKFNFDKGSVATSVHVHMNMQNETYLTVFNILTAYVLCESLLIRYSGPERLSNLFCLPVRDAEGILDKWISLGNAINRNQFTSLRILTLSPLLY